MSASQQNCTELHRWQYKPFNCLTFCLLRPNESAEPKSVSSGSESSGSESSGSVSGMYAGSESQSDTKKKQI